MQVKLINPEFKSNFGENILRFRGIKDVEWYLAPTDPKYLEEPTKLGYMEVGYVTFYD